MQASDAIAFLALAASLVSGFISYKAYAHSVTVHELETTLAFERERSELLIYVEQSRKLFSAAQGEIAQLRHAVDQEPLVVQRSLGACEDLFTEFQHRMVGSERQAGLLWDEIYEWREKSGRGALAHHGARYRALLDNDRLSLDAALKRAAELRAQIRNVHESYDQGHLL